MSRIYLFFTWIFIFNYLSFVFSDRLDYQRRLNSDWCYYLCRRELRQAFCFSQLWQSFWHVFILAFSLWRPFSLALMKKASGRFAASWINLPHTLSLMNSEMCASTSVHSKLKGLSFLASLLPLKYHRRRPASVFASVTYVTLTWYFMQCHAGLYSLKTSRIGSVSTLPSLALPLALRWARVSDQN